MWSRSVSSPRRAMTCRSRILASSVRPGFSKIISSRSAVEGRRLCAADAVFARLGIQAGYSELACPHQSVAGCTYARLFSNTNHSIASYHRLCYDFDIWVDRGFCAARVCPLICGKGQRADGDRCIQIGCSSGFFLNSSGACEKRPEPAPKPRAVTQHETAPARQSSPVPRRAGSVFLSTARAIVSK
jgi:hypothetical protein